MPTITDKQTAADIVATRTGAQNFPSLGNDEIKGGDEAPGLLDEAVVAVVWEAGTGYELKTVVIPVTQNGFCYELVSYSTSSDRESDATEPDWPIEKGFLVLDGGLIWECRGPAPACLWDLDLTCHLVWKRKVALSAHLSDVGLDARDQFRRSQVFEHCREMMEATTPFCVG